jgi:hypothetical protein
MTTGLKYHTKEADQHKKKLKEKPNTPKKANTGSTKLPLLIPIQLYWMRKVKTNSRRPVLRTHQILLQPITYIKNISSLIQLLEQIAKQQYDIKALPDNQVKVQPKTSESYRTIIKALTEKRKEFHTYKLKERRYRVVLKNMHYSINPEEIKTEIEKLGHMVTNIWNIKQYRTKLPLSMFFVELKPALNNKCKIYTTVQNKIQTAQAQKRLFNVQTVKDMGTPKIVISNRDVSNAQVTT